MPVRCPRPAAENSVWRTGATLSWEWRFRATARLLGAPAQDWTVPSFGRGNWGADTAAWWTSGGGQRPRRYRRGPSPSRAGRATSLTLAGAFAGSSPPRPSIGKATYGYTRATDRDPDQVPAPACWRLLCLDLQVRALDVAGGPPTRPDKLRREPHPARTGDLAASLAVQGVYVGRSSWKYPGWCGMLYDRARYEYRGRFADLFATRFILLKLLLQRICILRFRR